MSYFLKENIVGIFLVIVVLFLLMILTSVNQVEFKKNETNEKNNIKKVVLYETNAREGFNSSAYDPGLCTKTGGKRRQACHSKTDKTTCTKHNCCIWVSRFKAGGPKGKYKCLSGNLNGPENYDDKQITDEWYYKKRTKAMTKGLLMENLKKQASANPPDFEFQGITPENRKQKKKINRFSFCV